MKLPTAIAFDIDNTLVVSKQKITPEIAGLLAQISCAIPTAIISGAGMPQYLSQVISLLPPTACFEKLYLFPSDGAACFVHSGTEWIPRYTHTIPEAAALHAIRVIEEAFAETNIIAGEQHYGEIIENRGSSIAVSALGQQAPVAAKEKWDPDHKKRERVIALIAPQLPDFEVRSGGMTTIDITLKGIDKGYAMRWFADELHQPIEKILYVGDALYEGGNDVAVIATGMQTHAVNNPTDTEALLRSMLDVR